MFGGLVFEVPPGVVTVTPTAPEPGGAVAVIESSLATENDDAPAEPNLTEVAPVKPLPVIVTVDRSLLPAVSTPSECNRGEGEGTTPPGARPCGAGGRHRTRSAES